MTTLAAPPSSSSSRSALMHEDTEPRASSGGRVSAANADGGEDDSEDADGNGVRFVTEVDEGVDIAVDAVVEEEGESNDGDDAAADVYVDAGAPLSSASDSAEGGDARVSSRNSSQERTSETNAAGATAAPSSTASDANPLGAEIDGYGMKGYLSMRDEGLTYHRMKRFFCRCVGVNFCRFTTRDTASSLINAAFSAEIHKVESWDGKGLWHTYRNSFKLYFTTGAVFNVDADSEEDKKNWLEYIRSALKGTAEASDKWHAHADTHPSIMLLTLGGLGFADKKHHSRPAFKNQPSCSHPTCGLKFDSAKRQHHCRNCGGSVCSDHSSRFATLRHFSINDGVRLCTGCYRVQRFTVWLSMLLQRLNTAQLEGGAVKKPVLSKTDEEEVEALHRLFSDNAFGISDIIQVLHLHRHGCDEAYAQVVNKLLELAAFNLPDFEFFLPQLFQMWLTVDWSRNNIKAALLFRVICYAAQLHIRFATSIYWLTRAAIDDSCGWGFGQSELLIPDYLFRKFSLCKLMMINLEMQISQQEWSFQVDCDVPAPEFQAQMITCLFDRLHVLARASLPNKVCVSPLGEVCEVITACSIPPEFLQGSKLMVPSRLPDENGAEWRVFSTQIRFVEELCDMTERLRHCPPEERKAALKVELQKLELPEEAFCPIGSCEDPLQRFITIARNEGTVFTTRARAPTLVFFEVEMLTYLAGKSNWMQRARTMTMSTQGAPNEDYPASLSDESGVTDQIPESQKESTSDPLASKSAIELATSSDIGQALELNTLSEGTLSSEVASRADEDKHAIVSLNGSRANMIDEEEMDAEEREEARDRVASNPPPALVAATIKKKPGKSRRRRSGSLVTSTSKSLDSIIAVCSDTLNARKKRSVSEGEVLEAQAYAQRNSSPLFNEVEKFTKDQLIRMAQNLEISMLAGSPKSDGVFTGRDVVSWMTQNEIVFDEAHALWLGSELIDSGAIESAQAPPTSASSPMNASSPTGFTASESATYRLRSESTTIKPKHARNPADLINKKTSHPGSRADGSSSKVFAPRDATDAPADNPNVGEAGIATMSLPSSPSTSNGQERASSAYQADTSNQSGDDQHSSMSPSQNGSFMGKFKPDEALGALHSVEDAMEKHVFSRDDIEDLDKIREDLTTLKDQMEIIHEYVLDKRKQRHIAKESAFGESFEEKKERLRHSSRHMELCQSEGWDCVAFIVKSNDDLRQEVLCLQLIRQFQDIFQSADLPLRLLPYGIIATSASTGMIEYVKDATSLDGLKKRRGYTTLANHFLKTYGDVESPTYKAAMTNFVRSMAAYSLACYFLQIKDRHNGNIMIDSDGHVVHIDYGFILGIAPGGRFSLETAPFKLTAEMVEAMGGTQSEYFKAYVIFLIQGFLALQVRLCLSSLRPSLCVMDGEPRLTWC